MSIEPQSSEITLSTMTLDGYITNVKFDKVTAIESLELTERVVEIGCNFGHKISEEYKLMPCYKDRISKKKKRGELKTRRSQGLGTHFNSQITFTIITDKDENNSYQVKLFTNGRVQIPGIGKLSKGNDELLEDILSVMVSFIQMYPKTLMLNLKKDVEVDYLSPILQNFKALTLMTDDCMKETRIIRENEKSFQLVPFIDLNEFETALIGMSAIKRPPFPIDNMIFNPERYSGMLIKFSTPKIVTGNQKIDKLMEMARLYYHKNASRSRVAKPSYNDTDDRITRIAKMIQMKWYDNSKGSKKYRKKLTTVKLFRSGKINIDHVNDMDQAKKIREYVVQMLMDSWDTVIYYEE
jgi:hypothetical protein